MRYVLDCAFWGMAAFALGWIIADVIFPALGRWLDGK
jgi:hypothetical protein